MGLTFDELREALGFAGGATIPKGPPRGAGPRRDARQGFDMRYSSGDWFVLPGPVLDFGAHKGPRPAILKEDLGVRPYAHLYARSTTSKEGLEHAPHEASDGHPRSCEVDKRGRIVWQLRTAPRRHIVDDTFSCTEPDAAVIDAVRRR